MRCGLLGVGGVYGVAVGVGCCGVGDVGGGGGLMWWWGWGDWWCWW